MSRTLSRTTASRGDLVQSIADLADKLAPPAGETGLGLDAIAFAGPRSGSPP